jgi:hypothetical protein
VVGQAYARQEKVHATLYSGRPARQWQHCETTAYSAKQIYKNLR